MEPFLTGWNFGLIWKKNRRNKRKASLLTKTPPNGMHSPLVLIFTVFFLLSLFKANQIASAQIVHRLQSAQKNASLLLAVMNLRKSVFVMATVVTVVLEKVCGK